MPARHHFDQALRTVFTTAFGVFTDEDLIEITRILREDPRFESDFDQLFDFRGVTEVKVSTARVRETSRHLAFGEGSRRAFVVSSDVVYGMARMYELLRDATPDEIRVFRDMDEARSWLGLDPEG